MCIYGTINDDTSDGFIKVIIHDNTVIMHYSGMELLTFILGDDTHEVIDYIKSLMP